MRQLRVGFVNSGILGHRSVADLVRASIAQDGGIEGVHIDTSELRRIHERVIRRLMCFDGPRGGHGWRDALLLSRWRHEMHAGVVASRRLRDAERKHGAFDALHFHTQATAMASLWRMRRTPSVISLDITQQLARADSSSSAATLAYGPSVRHDRAIFRRAAAIVSPSHWAAASLSAEHPECRRRTHVLPYPVRLDAFPDDLAESRRAREESQPVRVLFVGGDFPRKGGDDLLQAWTQSGLAQRAELRLVTDWPLAARDLPEGVTVSRGIRAFTPEWSAAWRDADIFVMPTRSEAFGMVFQEAAAAGLPAIGTRLNAIPEIVSDGETGLLAPPGDIRKLLAALTSLVSQRDLRASMGAAARVRAEALWQVTSYGDRLASIIRATVGRAA